MRSKFNSGKLKFSRKTYINKQPKMSCEFLFCWHKIFCLNTRGDIEIFSHLWREMNNMKHLAALWERKAPVAETVYTVHLSLHEMSPKDRN